MLHPSIEGTWLRKQRALQLESSRALGLVQLAALQGLGGLRREREDESAFVCVEELLHGEAEAQRVRAPDQRRPGARRTSQRRCFEAAQGGELSIPLLARLQPHGSAGAQSSGGRQGGVDRLPAQRLDQDTSYPTAPGTVRCTPSSRWHEEPAAGGTQGVDPRRDHYRGNVLGRPRLHQGRGHPLQTQGGLTRPVRQSEAPDLLDQPFLEGCSRTSVRHRQRALEAAGSRPPRTTDGTVGGRLRLQRQQPGGTRVRVGLVERREIGLTRVGRRDRQAQRQPRPLLAKAAAANA